MVFDNISEALYYKNQLGGTINVLNRWKITDNGWSVSDDFVELPIKVKDTYEKLDKDIFIITQKQEADLANGFCYIKELVYQIHNDYIDNTQNVLRDNGIYPHSVKTDALTILKSDLPKAKELLNFKHERGAWRVQKDFCFPFCPFVVEDNYTLDLKTMFKDVKQTRIDTPNEWDSSSIAADIVKHKKVLIRARYPGSGKTFSCQQIENLGYTVLFVCPTNVGAQKNNGITNNNFLVLV